MCKNLRPSPSVSVFSQVPRTARFYIAVNQRGRLRRLSVLKGQFNINEQIAGSLCFFPTSFSTKRATTARQIGSAMLTAAGKGISGSPKVRRQFDLMKTFQANVDCIENFIRRLINQLGSGRTPCRERCPMRSPPIGPSPIHSRKGPARQAISKKIRQPRTVSTIRKSASTKSGNAQAPRT